MIVEIFERIFSQSTTKSVLPDCQQVPYSRAGNTGFTLDFLNFWWELHSSGRYNQAGVTFESGQIRVLKKPKK